jgi:hypothetical protein
MAPRLSNIRWGRILVAVLVVFLLSFTLVFCVVFVYGFGLAFQARGAPDSAQIQRFADQVAPWLGPLSLIGLTLLASLLLARRGVASPRAHGLLVGIGVAVISLFFDPPTNLANLVALILTIGAGWLGGYISSGGRSAERTAPPQA